MTTDELITNLGIAEDKKADAAKTVAAFLDGAYVPKSRFNEVNEEKKTLQQTVSERDKQLETLKKNTGDSETLKKQIKELQDKNKADAAEAEAKMKDLRLTSAIQVAVAGSAQDADIVAGLFDKDKLVLGEDGKVAGLDEQLKAIRESKPFLFKEDKKPPEYKPNGGSGGGPANPFAKETFNLTEQGRLFKENPKQAQALAAAANITIGGTD